MKRQTTYDDNSFLGLLLLDPKELLNWAFFVAIFFSFITLIFSKKETLIAFTRNHSLDLMSTSIGAVGLILSAIAIAVVIFSKKGQRLLAQEKELQKFLFPYLFSSFIWTLLALCSLFIIILEKANYICSLIQIFFLFYCILYTFRLIGEVLRMSILAALVDVED
ncbi:hypothetical protein JZO82_14700 [Vagococcus fluvialis]|uniref:hypothetical protein n=1 Tax=Vagococcus fluvialis TaxID=2738 RepID=UPI001A8D85AA|nr:hypothetical protein [Vagococcus fluvialis]MBO0430415.1 hypothetical protein [Vagococcus fluvialis]